METTKEFSLKAIDIHVDQLIPNEANVNEMDDNEVQRLAEEISDVGFLVPLNVVPSADHPGKYLILGGEHRWKAGRLASLVYLPCIVHTEEKWTDRDLLDLVAFRLNSLKGSQNPEKFIRLYDRMAQKFGAEPLQHVFAVTDKSLWKKLTKSIKKDMKKAGLPNDMVDEIDEIDRKSKDLNQFTKQLNKLFEKQAMILKTNSIVFANEGKESLIINASDNLFQTAKMIQDMTSEKGLDINSVLEPVFIRVLSELKT